MHDGLLSCIYAHFQAERIIGLSAVHALIDYATEKVCYNPGENIVRDYGIPDIGDRSQLASYGETDERDIIIMMIIMCKDEMPLACPEIFLELFMLL